MSGATGNAGTTLPVPDTFDFEAWMKIPPHIPHSGIALRIRNRENCKAELHNEDSKFQTIRCRMDRANHPDVGLPLMPYYDYAKGELPMMARNEEYEKAMGPVPDFVRLFIDGIRQKEKAKGVAGSLVLDKPVTRTLGQRPEIGIPNIICHSMVCGFKLPLHFFLDANLEMANFNIADLHTKKLAPESSLSNPSPTKLLVFDMAKMEELWGNDSSPDCLTPLKWQQASRNLLRTLDIMSEKPANTSRPTFHSEYKKHLDFFLNVPDFEDCYNDIYPFELKARQELLNGTLFDADYYARRVDSILDAKRAAAAHLIHPKRSADHSSSFDNRVFKSRRSYQTQARSATSASTPTSKPSNIQGSPPACIICGGAHRLSDHPTALQSFRDGKPLFSSYRNGTLTVAKSNKIICIFFNLPSGCNGRHSGPDEHLHICALCGGEHSALSRHPQCARMSDGKLLP